MVEDPYNQRQNQGYQYPKQQQYRQPAQQPAQQPSTYQQYQQQAYQQYPQYSQAQQPQPQSPPSEGRQIPVKLIGLVVGVLIIAVVLFVVIKAIGSLGGGTVEEVAPVEVVELEPKITVASNEFVFNDEVLLKRDNSVYEIGEDVFVYTVFEGFEHEQTPEGKYKVDLTYGVTVSQPEYAKEYELLSNENLMTVRKDFDREMEDYYFTARIPTASLLEGYYTVTMIGKDRISGEEIEDSMIFELKEPLALKVVTLETGEFNDEGKYFMPKKIDYSPGDTIEAYFEIRGFDVVNNTPDVVVDLYVTDVDGAIVKDVSQSAIYVNNIVYVTAPVVMMVNLEIPTEGLAPGEYKIQILAKDRLPSLSSLKSEPFTILRK